MTSGIICYFVTFAAAPLLAPSAVRYIRAVIRIAISAAAFDAICATLPLGSVGYENAVDVNGDPLIWLPHDALAKLRHLRGPGESYSAVILRLAAEA